MPLKWQKEPPASARVAVGRPLRVACVARGNPTPTVRWRRLDTSTTSYKSTATNLNLNLNSNSLLASAASSTMPELSLSSVTVSDSGFYECTASNGSDEDLTAIVRVEVVGK